MADYLPQNRNELCQWTTGQSSFDWTPVLKMIAMVEGSGWSQLKEMEEYARSKVVILIALMKFFKIFFRKKLRKCGDGN